jgi:hypothetical protein
MKKRLIAAEAIEAGEALTCVKVEPGPGPGDFDFKIGVIRGDRDYQIGPLGCAERSFAAGEVLQDVEEPVVFTSGITPFPAVQWSAPIRSTPVADMLALREEFRGSSS